MLDIEKLKYPLELNVDGWRTQRKVTGENENETGLSEAHAGGKEQIEENEGRVSPGDRKKLVMMFLMSPPAFASICEEKIGKVCVGHSTQGSSFNFRF